MLDINVPEERAEFESNIKRLLEENTFEERKTEAYLARISMISAHKAKSTCYGKIPTLW